MAGEGGGTEHGPRPILTAANADCALCNRAHDMEICPMCGSDISIGYGLGFGPGLGEYKFCLDEHEKSCKWAWKREDNDDGD